MHDEHQAERESIHPIPASSIVSEVILEEHRCRSLQGQHCRGRHPPLLVTVGHKHDVDQPVEGAEDQGELHCSRRGMRVTKASHDFGNIIKGEDGSVVNLDNISTLETLLEGFEGPMLRTSTTTKDPGDMSPMKMRASVKLKTKGSIICEVKWHHNGMHTNKCARRHIKSRQGHISNQTC